VAGAGRDYREGVSEGRVSRARAPVGSVLLALRRSWLWLWRIRTVNRVWRLTRETVSICMRYRVTGLASEAGFFALLSLPPLVLGLFGGVGYFGRAMGRDNVQALQDKITDLASKVLTTSTVASAITPTLNDVFKNGRADLISIGFVLSLWSGSRVLNVFVDTISIMYGQSGVRGIVRTRALSFSLYVASLIVGVVIFPLVILGPVLLGDILNGHAEFLLFLYWPLVTILTIASLSSLYWISTPRRTSWVRNVPGATLALVIWLGASVVLRWFLGASVGPRSTSIYGPLAAPIVVLIWLYFLAIAVLIGAALNAATRALWPSVDRARRFSRTRPESARRTGSKPTEMRAEPPAEPQPPPRPLTPMPQAPRAAEVDARRHDDRAAEIEVTGRS
jgi:membrane protein